jgi:hypothetical protein
MGFAFRLLVLVGLLVGAGSAQAQNRFWLVNDSGLTVEEAYVSPSRLAEWGEDVLGAGVLPAGQRFWVVPLAADCRMDIRVRFAGGAETTLMGVEVCDRVQQVLAPPVPGAPVPAPPQAAVPSRSNPSFTFVNQTGATIREVYVSLTTDNDWGPDRLGADVLAPGQRMPVPLPEGGVCTVDMRVVFMDGSAQERRAVETCSIADYVWR